jgi:hypothetical protein
MMKLLTPLICLDSFGSTVWIEDREKAKNDLNSGWDTTTHDRIAQLAGRVLQ